jgi:hypothetical protein
MLKIIYTLIVTYHYIENNGLIFVMELKRFNNEFVRLNIKEQETK